MTRTRSKRATPIASALAFGATALVLGATAIALALGATGCDVGSPASPVFENGDGGVIDGGNYVICPPGLGASYASLLTQMFQASGCGADRPLNCHSASGAGPTGTGNLLDFSVDAAAIYDELVGPNGAGVPSTNLSGNAQVLRVAPGDASASMLYIKLMLKTSANKQYGAGMPQDYPGSVCPAALDAVKEWIDQGAKK